MAWPRGVRRVVVDTSVVSYLLKGHSSAPQYREFLRGNLAGLSFMSLAELNRWPIERNWGDQRIAALREHLVSYIVLFPDEETCRVWARLVSRKGRPVSVPDAWIAAAALQFKCPLVTHNVQHFESIEGLSILTVPV